jgi:hypothetical protein
MEYIDSDLFKYQFANAPGPSCMLPALVSELKADARLYDRLHSQSEPEHSMLVCTFRPFLVHRVEAMDHLLVVLFL